MFLQQLGRPSARLRTFLPCPACRALPRAAVTRHPRLELPVNTLPLVWVALFLSAALDAAAQTRTADELFADQIVEPGLAETERDHSLVAKPELFIQSRFSRGVMKGAAADVNFQMTRIETRWSGRLTERLGAGLEIQFHPALDGAPEGLVNDAFVEHYATSRLTVRLGQFIKPFGFDIQQSSADREYPERGIFAGYFFPGQRDRGAMLTWLLGGDSSSTAHTQVYAAVLNGNRFWNDNNDRLDTVLRIRRLIPQRQLAVGASLQIGSQIVPSASDRGNVRIVGLDAQYSVHRVGLRAEWVHGTRPSTLLALDPVFTEAYAPGTSTDGLRAVPFAGSPANHADCRAIL